MKERSDKSPAEKRFRVYACSCECPHVDVMAKDAGEAMEIAEGIDGGHFDSSNDWDNGSWDIDSAEEVSEADSFHPIDESLYGTR
jgi:hypothetical protein